MARYEIADVEAASLGEAAATADTFFELGMMYSIGRSVPVDLVSAHKWFNIAAMRGNRDAIRLRREVADQMSEADIAAAQREARDLAHGALTRRWRACPRGRIVDGTEAPCGACDAQSGCGARCRRASLEMPARRRAYRGHGAVAEWLKAAVC